MSRNYKPPILYRVNGTGAYSREDVMKKYDISSPTLNKYIDKGILFHGNLIETLAIRGMKLYDKIADKTYYVLSSNEACKITRYKQKYVDYLTTVHQSPIWHVERVYLDPKTLEPLEDVVYETK